MNIENNSEVLRPGKMSSVLLLVGSLIFVVVGIYLGISGKWIGYLCAAFFGLGIPLAIIQLIPSASYLELGPDGFVICHVFRKRFVPWSAVERFHVIDVTPTNWSKTKRVGFDFLHLDGPASTGQEFVRSLAGSEDMLPNNYGKKVEALMELMNAHLERSRNG